MCNNNDININVNIDDWTDVQLESAFTRMLSVNKEYMRSLSLNIISLSMSPIKYNSTFMKTIVPDGW